MSTSLRDIRLFLLDIDGVILIGKTPIEVAPDGVRMLRRKGAKVTFITNNSTRSRNSLLSELMSAGLDARREEILTTSYCAAKYLRSEQMSQVYAIGEKGLVEELTSAGIELADEKTIRCDAVVVGLDRNLTYNKLATAQRLIGRGARFIATNADATLPTETGLIPGAGAIVSALTTCTGVKPIVLGKPETMLMQVALKVTRMSKERCAIVGDRPETDILMAKRGGCLGILVLTGISASQKVEDYPPDQRPDLIFKSILDLAEKYRPQQAHIKPITRD